jgi:hypothetical protein
MSRSRSEKHHPKSHTPADLRSPKSFPDFSPLLADTARPLLCPLLRVEMATSRHLIRQQGCRGGAGRLASARLDSETPWPLAIARAARASRPRADGSPGALNPGTSWRRAPRCFGEGRLTDCLFLTKAGLSACAVVKDVRASDLPWIPDEGYHRSTA